MGTNTRYSKKMETSSLNIVITTHTICGIKKDGVTTSPSTQNIKLNLLQSTPSALVPRRLSDHYRAL